MFRLYNCVKNEVSIKLHDAKLHPFSEIAKFFRNTALFYLPDIQCVEKNFLIHFFEGGFLWP